MLVSNASKKSNLANATFRLQNAVTFGSIWQYGDSTVEIYVKWNSSRLSKFLVEIEILNLAN